jgi:hypothetical protein
MTLGIVNLRMATLSMLALNAECCYSECRKQAYYAECCYTECRYADCRFGKCPGARFSPTFFQTRFLFFLFFEKKCFCLMSRMHKHQLDAIKSTVKEKFYRIRRNVGAA